MSDNKTGGKESDPPEETDVKTVLDGLVARMKEANLASERGKSQEDYKFWKTQPVIALNEVVSDNCAIEPDIPEADRKSEPIKLPPGYEWAICDLQDDAQLEEVQLLLADNYVEDSDATFRFEYGKEILKWALMPPGYLKEFHLGVRVSSNKRLLAFIGGIPMKCRTYDVYKDHVEINFLCVHKKLRSKRLAPVLIREITRRVNLTGVFQAVYTSGTYLPTPVTQAKYFHRSLNVKKLIECRFAFLKKNMTLARTIKLNKLAEKPQIPGFRETTEADIQQIAELYQHTMKDMDFQQVMTADEIKHFILPRPKVLHSFVVEDPTSKLITGFVSFYTVDNQILNNPKYKSMSSAYLWFYGTKDDDLLPRLVNDALISARNTEHDVMNCLEVLHNSKFINDLKFNPGDGTLNFYLYNWRCPPIKPSRQGLMII